MNYPKHQFSKHLHCYLMSYGYCSICAPSANNYLAHYFINKLTRHGMSKNKKKFTQVNANTTNF